MIFLKLLLNSALIFIGGTALLTKENLENNSNSAIIYRLQDFIKPIHYRLNIELQQFVEEEEIKSFSGECHVFIKIEHPTWNISLHAQQPQIEIKDISLSKFNSKKYYVPKSDTYHYESHILVFHFSEEISSGYHTLNMQFDNSLSDGESFFQTSIINDKGDKSWLLATDFYAIGARQIFPCWDEPTFKATFVISIRHNEEYIALSNTLEQNVGISNVGGMRWTHFDFTPEISTYLVAFLVTSNVSYHLQVMNLTNDKFEINIWYRPHLITQVKFAQSVIKHVTLFLGNHSIQLKKISTVHHILIPALRHNSIKKWKRIFYRETDIIYDDEIDSVARKIEIAHLIAREMAHQSFPLCSSWWSDHWLYEGIAALLGTDIVNKIYLESRMAELYVVQIQQESLRLDSDFIMEPLISTINEPSEINSLFSFSYYIKASVILRMLQHILTVDVFKTGIEEFFNKTSPTLDDFWYSMQSAHDLTELSHMEKFNIKEKLDPWIQQKHYPILEVRHNSPYYLSISIINIDNSDSNTNWWIPLTITKQTEPDFTISNNWHAYNNEWISHSGIDNFYFPHERNEWIIVNLQQIGYYRVNYETENWRHIAKYLNTPEYTKIHVLNRAQIIDDAYYFLKTDQLSLSIFLELTKYLSQETDYVAWYPMFKALEDMSTIFSFRAKRIDTFKTNILGSLNGLLQNIGYNETSKDDDLTKCLRQEAIKWACILGDGKCLEEAEFNLQLNLKNHMKHKKNKFLPWYEEWMYCNGLRTANSDDWEIIWKRYKEKPDNKILKFLVCSQNLHIIKMLREAPKNCFGKIQVHDHLSIFHYIIERHAKHNLVLDNILTNFEYVKPKQFSTIAALIDIINHIYSQKQLSKIKNFVENIWRNQEISIMAKNIFFDDKLLNEMNEYMRNIINQRVLLIHQKIELRSSQIKKQKDHFQYLMDKERTSKFFNN